MYTTPKYKSIAEATLCIFLEVGANVISVVTTSRSLWSPRTSPKSVLIYQSKLKCFVWLPSKGKKVKTNKKWYAFFQIELLERLKKRFILLNWIYVPDINMHILLIFPPNIIKDVKGFLAVYELECYRP